MMRGVVAWILLASAAMPAQANPAEEEAPGPVVAPRPSAMAQVDPARMGDLLVDGPEGPGRHHYAMGLALAGGGLFDAAIDEFAAAIEMEPDVAVYQARYGMALLEAGRTVEALEALESATSHEDAEGPWWLSLGIARQQVGDHEGAEVAFEEAVSRLEGEAQLVKARVWLARSFLRRAQASSPPDAVLAGRAVEHFLEALALQPGHALVHYQLGDALVARGDLEIAREHYRRSAELAPSRPEPHERLLEIEERLAARRADAGPLAPASPAESEALARAGRAHDRGDLDEAARVLRAWLGESPGSVAARFNLGGLYLAASQPATAQEIFESLAAEHPDLAEVHDALGQAHHAQALIVLGSRHVSRERSARALEAFERAAALAPKQPSYLMHAAEVHHGLRQHAEAADVLGRAVELDSGNALAHVRLGEALRLAGRPDEARLSLERGVELDPELADGWLQLGLLESAAGRPEAAIEALRRGLALDPALLAGRYELGLALRKAGRVDEAREELAVFRAMAPEKSRLELLENRLRLNPRHLGVREEMARIFRDLGLEDLARRELTLVLDMSPDHAGARELLEELEGGEGG